MKLRLRFLMRIIFIFFLTTCIYSKGWSQPDQDQDDQDQSGDGDLATNGFGDPGQDPDLPIDSNIFILVAAGVGYGLKKVYDFKKKQAVVSQSTTNY